MRKGDLARRHVAGRLLATEQGQRIPTTAELASGAGVGHGTIAAALQSLTDDEAVHTSSHGHQGTVLRGRDVLKLWAAAGRGPLTGVLPLPQSREFSGLATAVSVLADRHGISAQLLYRQGATQRVEALRSGRVDWVAASAPAVATEGPDLASTVLPPHTYYGRDAVVVITASGRGVDPTGRVPIDRSSHDHARLTQAAFPDANLVDAPYLSIPELVTSGEADAAVWHRTSSSPLLVAAGLDLHPFDDDADDHEQRSRAALCWRIDDPAVGTVLTACLPADQLVELQQEVIDGARVPRY